MDAVRRIQIAVARADLLLCWARAALPAVLSLAAFAAALYVLIGVIRNELG